MFLGHVYIFFGIIILLETLTSERADRGGRPRAGALGFRAGALPLAPLTAVFFHYDNLTHLYPKNPTDGLLIKFGGGIYPVEYSRSTFDPYINIPLTSAFNTNSLFPSSIRAFLVSRCSNGRRVQPRLEDRSLQP